ncbi:MAG: hypothetical protein WCE69_17400 [Aestuariivirga sp.]
MIRNSAFALAVLFSAAPMMADHASAKASFMQECSAKWKAAKAAGTVAAGTKWADFMKTDCSANADQSAAAPTSSSKKAKPAAVAMVPAGGTFMKNCSAEWKAMKDAGNTPAGLTWKQFVKQSCVLDGTPQSTSDSTADPVPAEPTNVNYNNIEVKTVDKNGKPFTLGQIAAHKRIKECAGEWRGAKGAGTLPAGTKWPQFWSSCNTRLKAQG